MELVNGVPITDFCDQNRLSVRERLELFVPVCQAVQHAHQKGVIHRDLKPSNILVALSDGKPVPKVIDFGVAKATGPNLIDHTAVTEVGMVIGTLEYMSPEQAGRKQLDIDTRSDVYSLGVVLYELLTGTTPLTREWLGEADWLELLRVIREEEPPKPSTRLGATEGLPAIAANRGLEPKKLTGLVRGELDWIAMRCLEKDRTRRYETAGGLARDIERYLRDEPVEASPPGAGYRLRKLVKRHKGRVAAAGLVLAALLAGMAGTTWGMVRAERARREALSAQSAEADRAEGERRAKEEAEKRTEILASVFRDMGPAAAERAGVPLRDLLRRRLGEAARQLEGEAVGDPLGVARLQHVLGISLRELGHLEQAEAVLVKACQTRERLLGADDLDTVATKHYLAILYREQGKYARAEAPFQEALAVRAARLGADHPDTLTTRHHLAALYHSQAKYALAEALYRQVLAARTAELGADHPDTLTTRQHLASLYYSQGKYAPAEALYQEALAVRAAKLGADHPDTLTTRHHLAALYLTQGKDARAEALLHEVLAARLARLGADHPDTLAIQHDLALVYLGQGKYALAEATYQEVVAGRAARLGADHPATLYSKINLAALYYYRKQLDRSIPLLEETLKLCKAKHGPALPEALTLGVQRDLGLNYLDVGRVAEAIALLEEVHRKGGQDPNLAGVGEALLRAYEWAGKTAAATALAAEQGRAARH